MRFRSPVFARRPCRLDELLVGVLVLSVCVASYGVVMAQNGTEQSAVPALYRGFAALCAVAKNENRYVREWVDYHKCFGADCRGCS